MRYTRLLTLPLLGALFAMPVRAPAQLNLNIRFGTRLGPEIGVYSYAPDRMGDWRTNYRQWTPVTLYDVNGRYYRSQVRGARAVQVYLYNNEYFLPPQDRDWNNRDRRYNYRRMPGQDDYGRARPYTPDGFRVDARYGTEIGVMGYSQERAGDWRTNTRRWTPVTLYEVNGRYFTNRVGNARPVSMYRYQNEYFLPPSDQGWVNSDRRFNYANQPNDQDRQRARIRP